jgi:hypothetical protein
MSRYYASYGSNTNPDQMADRCKTAKLVGAGVIRGWKLTFRSTGKKSVANIEQEAGAAVPVVVWSLEAADEDSLDVYEGVKYKLYQKDTLPAETDGGTLDCLVYILQKPGAAEPPSQEYFLKVEEGYKAAGIDTKELRRIAGRD